MDTKDPVISEEVNSEGGTTDWDDWIEDWGEIIIITCTVIIAVFIVVSVCVCICQKCKKCTKCKKTKKAQTQEDNPQATMATGVGGCQGNVYAMTDMHTNMATSHGGCQGNVYTMTDMPGHDMQNAAWPSAPRIPPEEVKYPTLPPPYA